MVIELLIQHSSPKLFLPQCFKVISTEKLASNLVVDGHVVLVRFGFGTVQKLKTTAQMSDVPHFSCDHNQEEESLYGEIGYPLGRHTSFSHSPPLPYEQALLAGHTVAMVIYCAKKMISYLPMIGQLRFMIVAGIVN